MGKRTLYLFPDTNLFIQCRPLEDLDWSEWGEFEEVHLIVCSPVQREIDDQKYRGNDRVGQRARKTNQMFRGIVLSQDRCLVIQEATPRVLIYFLGAGFPSQELTDRLDYNKPDDQIIGHVHRYRQNHPDHDIRLLTHDTRPHDDGREPRFTLLPHKRGLGITARKQRIRTRNRPTEK